jgi:hypothetical protein
VGYTRQAKGGPILRDEDDGLNASRGCEKKTFVSISWKPQYSDSILTEMVPPPGQVPGVVARAAAGDRAAIVDLPRRHRNRAALDGESDGS